jgi:hypothetical protein
MKKILLKMFVFAALSVLAIFLILNFGKTSAQKNLDPAFSEFDNWAKSYLDGDRSNDPAFINSGEELAFKRRELFKKLIQTDPRAAIERAIPEDVRISLPSSVSRFLEDHVSAVGDLNVYAVDNFDSGSETLEREIVIGKSKYKGFVYGRKTSMTTKLKIPLRGVVLDDLMAVDENSVRKIEPAEYASKHVDPTKVSQNGIVAESGGKLVYFSGREEFDSYVSDLAAWESKIAPDRTRLSPWTEGSKTILFIRVDYPDRPGEPIDRFGQPLTAVAAQNLIDGPVSEFYVANSYQKTALRATVTPVVRMPQPQTAYTRDDLFALVTDARAAALAAGFDTDNYDLDIVGYSYTTLHNFSGISPIGNKGALLNGSFTFKVATHELGHEYGLGHANLWRSSDGDPIGTGLHVEYGDDFDMMGRGTTPESHFSAGYKRTLDWLKEENVKTVTNSGVYRVFAQDTTAADPQGFRALKIRKDNLKNYWIEFRQLFTGIPNLMDGALIRWDMPIGFWREAELLDMKPDTQSLLDSSLLVGQTFQDTSSGIKITVLNKGGTVPESLDVSVVFTRKTPFDFDGDGKTDLSIFRPAPGEWWYSRSSDGGNYAAQFGNAADKLVPGDFTGDGKADVAVWRPSSGEWFVLRSEDSSYFSFPFGATGDIPAPSDYDGDGLADQAVFRPQAATWYIRYSSSGQVAIQSFGLPGDKPVPADYDGDGRSDIAIFRPGAGEWWIRKSSDASVIAFQFGTGSDRPAAGDYTGDGKADAAFWRPSTGEWFILRSENYSYFAFPFGTAGDVPAPGDYDGDGRFDAAVFRPSDSTWYIQKTTAGIFIQRFGQAGDVPVPNAFIP